MFALPDMIARNPANNGYRLKIEKGKAVFLIPQSVLNPKLACSMMRFADYIENKRKLGNIPVVFWFQAPNVTILDKISYVLFECVCYYLIKAGHPVFVHLVPKPNILAFGYQSSPLNLLTTGDRADVRKYMEKFGMDIYKRHYRRIIKNCDKDRPALSALMDDIVYFQEPFNIKEESREKIAEVLAELVGNALEHTESDCLIDIDISNDHSKRDADPSKKYKGINIAIMNISSQLLGKSLEDKILHSNEELSDRYKMVADAYSKHCSHFCEYYDAQDFFNIAVFQHKISGRSENDITGGTGLTKLIKSLEEESDAYRCYVISGDRCVIFKHEYMKYSKDDWIGFNENNDFMNEPPDYSLIQRLPLFFPGTGYNLNFVMEDYMDGKQ